MYVCQHEQNITNNINNRSRYAKTIINKNIRELISEHNTITTYKYLYSLVRESIETTLAKFVEREYTYTLYNYKNLQKKIRKIVSTEFTEVHKQLYPKSIFCDIYPYIENYMFPRKPHKYKHRKCKCNNPLGFLWRLAEQIRKEEEENTRFAKRIEKNIRRLCLFYLCYKMNRRQNRQYDTKKTEDLIRKIDRIF